MKKHLLLNQSFGTEGSPNQTGETLTRENRIGLMSYLRRTLMLLFAVLVMSMANIGTAWGTDFDITVDQIRTLPTRAGFVKLTNGSDCTASSGKLQVANNKTGTFTIESTVPSVYKIKSITFTLSRNRTSSQFTCTDGGSISGSDKSHTFTPTSSSPVGSASFSLDNSSAGGGTNITFVVTMTTEETVTVETLHTFSLTTGVYSFTSSAGTTKINLTDVGTDAGKISSNMIQFEKSGSKSYGLNVAAKSGYDLSFVSIYYYDCSQDPKVSADVSTYTKASYTWVPSSTATNVTLTFDTENAHNINIYRIYVGYVTAASKDYTVTAATSTGTDSYGTVEADASSLDEGETTTITATPAAGYQVSNWAVSGTGASISPSGDSHDNTTTLTMGTANATVTVTFEKVYANGSYTFEGNSSLGSEPNNKTCGTGTDSDFRIDNIFFKGGSYEYDNTGSGGTGDGDNFNGWKMKSATCSFSFYVENDCDVTIGIGSVGDGGGATITYTQKDGTAKNNISLTAATNNKVDVKGGTLVTVAHNNSTKTVTLKKIIIEDAASLDKWYLHGNFDDVNADWTDTEIADGATNEGYVDLDLDANTTYSFTVKHVTGGSTYWSRNAGTWTRYHNNEEWPFTSAEGDCSLRTDIAGTYRVAFRYHDSKPKITVTFPTGVLVTLDYNHSGLSEPWQAVSGEPMPTPPTPTRTDYAFSGWYTSSACTTPFNFDLPITSATTIYAKWDPAWKYVGAVNWSNYITMTRSSNQMYWYYTCTGGGSKNEFILYCGSTAYYRQNIQKGFNGTNITANNEINDGNDASWGVGNNCAVYKSSGTYYIIVYPANTAANQTNSPIICASTVLPNDESFYSFIGGAHKIYFDNTSTNWSTINFRVGRSNHSHAPGMTKVKGTDSLYECTPDNYQNYFVYQVANNSSWQGDNNSIYQMRPGSYDISEATVFQRQNIFEDITLTPGDVNNTEGGVTYYKVNQTRGMKTDRVTISDYSNGTITVNYTNTSNVASTLTSGYADLAHTVILSSITATPNTGYDASAITINGGAYSANYVVTGATTIAATFTLHNYNVTYSAPSNGSYTIKVADGMASSASKTATYGQTITLAASASSHYHFTGWTITNTDNSTDITNSVSLSGQTENATFTMPAANISITATFAIDTYTVNFASNNVSYGTVSSSSISSVPHGSAVSINGSTNALTLNGSTITVSPTTSTAAYTYAFDHWSVADEATITSAQTITATFTQTANTYDVDLTLTDSHATKKSGTTGTDAATYGSNYTLTFAAVTGYELPSDVIVYIGESQATKDDEYTWSISDGTGTLTIDGDEILDDITITVTAVSAGPTYTVTYSAGASTTCKGSDTQASEGADITLATPTTTNDSTFKGWYIKGELVTAATYRPTSDVTAYALWHKNCAGGGGGGSTTIFKAKIKSSGMSALNSEIQALNTNTSFTTSNYLSELTGGSFTLNISTAGHAKANDDRSVRIVNTSAYFIITLSDGTFRAGDIIKASVRNQSGYLQTSSGSYSASTDISITKNNEYTSIITNAMAGKSTLYLKAASGNMDFDSIEIIRPSEVLLYMHVKDELTNGNMPTDETQQTTSNNLSVITGGTIYAGAGTAGHIKIVNTNEIQINNNTGYLKLVLPKALEEGDVLYFRSTTSQQISITKTASRSTTITTSGYKYPIPKSSTLIGESTIWLWYYSSAVNVKTLAVVRPGGSGGGGATCWHVKYLGGTGVDGGYVVDAAAYANNASATVKTNSNPGFTREGYTFNGWQDGAGNSFTAGSSSITMTKDTTLIAQWTSAVCAAPTITAQTEIQEIDLGERPEFSITATGAGSYQWYTCGADGSGEVVIDGATSSTYSPVAPTVVGTSYYKCKAIASCDASYVTYSDVIPCVVSPTNFTIHYETNTSTSSTNYDIAHLTQTKEVNSEVTSYITSLTNFAKTSGITISDAAKTQDKVVTMSGKISVLAAYDENEYLSYTFTVANNYYLSIDSIDIRCQPVGGDNRNFKVVLTDALGTTITGNISTTTSGVLNRIPFTSAELNGKKLVGTVTVKIYGWYTSADTYRLARHSYIYGKVSSLPAPSVSWDSHPNTAMVGDGGKTYSITTDGTNSVTWTIEDQTGATDAALSGSDKSSRTLGSYSAAGTLYVQAAVTGDGSHYNSSLTTTLRQFVTIAPNCGTTTLISATLASATTTGTVTGTPGGSATVAFESSKESDGGYKMGKDGSYMYLTLGSGNFAEGDVVSVVITAAPNIPTGETPTLHIYKYMSSIWTELGSVRATEAGTYNYTLTAANTATDFNCIGLYRTDGNQNPFVKSMTVSRNDCSGSRPSSVSVSASAAGPYAKDASVTLTVTATDATSYQWYSNTSNSTSGGTILEGRTSETYSPSTALAGTTYYYCVATNSYGSTASNVIEVTVNSTKTDPSAVWTGTETTPVYGGGGYTVTVVAKDGESGLWDGDLTADMLTAPTGVRLSDVTVSNTTKTITAQYGVTEAAESPIVFSLTLPETANHNSAELTFDDATFTTCSGDGGEGTSYKIRVRNYATSNISATNKFAWETPGAGRISGKISSSLSGNAKASTVVDGFDTICTTNIQDVWVQPFAAGVNKIRVYANYTVKENTVDYIYKMSTFINGDSKSAVTYSVVYNGDDEAANTGTTGYKYVDITLNEAMDANEIVRIHFSKNLNLTGAVVTVPGGGDGTRDKATTIAWLDEGSGTPAGTVEKTTIDADFKYAATKTGNANALASLGAISYSSSDVTVATVNATTGVVNIQGAGTTTIKATLAASGCYRKAELSYTLSVTASTCTDAAGTITASIGGTPIEGNTVNKEACETVRLTVSGHLANDGVRYQWKRNGASISGSGAYIDVTDGGDYTVDVTNTGDGHCTMPATNTITVNSASLSASAIVDKWYVKNGRRTPDVALVAIEGTTSWKVNDGTNDIWVVENGVLNKDYDDGFAGCQFELRDGIVYLKGTKTDGSAPSGLTAGNVTLTITAVNECGGADASANVVITKQAPDPTDKPQVAFVVTGTKGDPVNNVATSLTSERGIWTSLSTSYDLTGCNAYWTNNEKAIREYYSQFDAIVITDDPSTDEKPASGKKYVDALGTMVDVRPLLTMEAFVGKYGSGSNWHINATPSSPNPRQYELKLQCKDHDIFKGIEDMSNFRSSIEDGETYYYVTMVDNSVTPYKGVADDAETNGKPALQGFSAAAVQGSGLLGIGTILNGTLQGGVERQEEPAARMIILGIQNQAMAALTAEGKKVIANAIEYLLLTNMEDVNDCSNYFIGNAATGSQTDWSNSGNWSSGKLPDHSTKARILSPVVISDGTKVQVAQVDIVNSGTSKYKAEPNGQLTIKAGGALLVDGQVRRAEAPYFGEDDLMPTEVADLVIGSDETNGNGTLIFDNSNGETQATVEYYTKSTTDENTTWNWQYMAVPFNDNSSAHRNYYDSYLYRWSEACTGWDVVPNRGEVYPWVGYCITQVGTNTYHMDGTLVETGEQVFTIPGDKALVLGNSWSAPIQVKQLTDDDFVNLHKNVYLFNTGYDPDSEGKFDIAEGRYAPGTYVTIPIHSAPYTGDSMVSSLQAFIVYTDGASDGTLTLDYDRHVRPARSTDKVNAGPMHAPRRGASISDEPAVLKIYASGSRYDDRLVVLERGDFSTGLDDGWDGDKRISGNVSPHLYAETDNGKESVSAIPDMEGTLLGFRAGEDNAYTLHFYYSENEALYLLDLENNIYTPVNNESSYTFVTSDKSEHTRFILTRTAPGIATGVTDLDADAPKVQKVIYNDKLYIIRGGKVFSAEGQLVK